MESSNFTLARPDAEIKKKGHHYGRHAGLSRTLVPTDRTVGVGLLSGKFWDRLLGFTGPRMARCPPSS